MNKLTTILSNVEDKKIAEIEFLKLDNKWKFMKCKFKTETIPYSYNDWKFLAEVGNYICSHAQGDTF